MKKYFIFLFIVCSILLFDASYVHAQAGATKSSTTTTTAQAQGSSAIPKGYYQCSTAQGKVIVQCENQGGGILGQLGQECACCGNCKFDSFKGLAIIITNTLLGITGSLALLMFVYGGFTWVTSGGSSDRVAKGKQILTQSVIGVIIVLTAYLLVDFVLKTLTGSGLS